MKIADAVKVEGYCTTNEAAKLLFCKNTMVIRWVHLGRLRYRRRGPQILIEFQHIQEIIANGGLAAFASQPNRHGKTLRETYRGYEISVFRNDVRDFRGQVGIATVVTHSESKRDALRETQKFIDNCIKERVHESPSREIDRQSGADIPGSG